MDFPDFFAAAPAIAVHDPLASFPGVSGRGAITCGRAEAVQRAGHVRPTVAGAFLMALQDPASPDGDKVPEHAGDPALVDVHRWNRAPAA